MDVSDGEIPSTTVVGLGNVLMADDAFGPYFIHWLQAHYHFPPELELADLGTPGLDLYPHLVHREVVIIADTVRSEGKPGELRLYRRDEILRHTPTARVGPHDPGLKETLLSLEFAGLMPREVFLVGVIPESTGSTLGLSPPVKEALAPAGSAVVAELGRLGFRVLPRKDPPPLDLWWERPQHEPGAGG
jgi:hydrogenase maturation protease